VNLGLYVAIATRAFRRYSTYRAATLAGIFTNSVFGVIYSYAYLALWAANPDAGGYDVVQAVTFVWLGQALLMSVAVFGGGSTEDLAERIRTGDVSIDLYRPVGLIGWYLAADLGRATYHLLSRGLAPLLIGFSLFELTLPASPVNTVAFLVGLVLAVVLSFTIRFMVACSGFWLLDSSGLRVLFLTCAIFFSGMTLPLVLFPGWLGTVAEALPFAGFIQVPIDLWLGRYEGWELVSHLGFQVAWILVLLGGCHATLRAATRKVVVQGG